MPAESSTSAPSPSKPFAFSCQCLNVIVESEIPQDETFDAGSSSSSNTHKVWLNEWSDRTKQAAYVTWDSEDFRPSRRPSKSATNGEGNVTSEGACWRTCWLCKSKVYSATGKKADDGPVVDEWVTIELGPKLLSGKELEQRQEETNLPFSSLRLPLDITSSAFGRQPQSNSPSLYPPTQSSKPIRDLIPPVHDPFFLPPPFIPSHPHLRELCENAVIHLKAEHQRLEEEVQEYIALKAREMRDLEDKVRCEVEMLWERLRDVPGRAQEMERSRSSSQPRGDKADVEALSKPKRETNGKFSPPTQVPAGPSQPTNNPIVNESIMSPPYPGGASLLSASISANTFHAPPPPPKVADKLDDGISEASKMTLEKSEARSVAMSYVFSTFDDAMGDHAHRRRRSSTQQVPEETEAELEREARESLEAETDSWIEEERRVLAAQKAAQAEKEDAAGRTPKPPAKKELQGDDKGKDKHRAVTFEEPGHSVPSEVDNGKDDEDEYVFDFEIEEDPSKRKADAVDTDGDQPRKGLMRQRNMVEANLSRTFAADAPSHRAAWRRMEQGSSIYASLRRSSTDSIGDDEDEGAVSKLAISMPVEIAINRAKKQSEATELQRKTSLADRGGILVPNLIAAMRRTNSPGQGALGISPGRPTRADGQTRKTSRSASVSRERDMVMSYKADPGVVFETLGDEQDGEDSDEDDQSGTLRESRNFVPPHVIARNEGRDEGDVGWRSLVTE